MKSVAAVLALACAAVLGAPASATDLHGSLATPQQGSQASQTRALHAVVSEDEFCGEVGEKPCAGTGCATGFELNEEGVCMFTGDGTGRSLLQSRVNIDSFSRASIGRRGSRRRGGNRRNSYRSGGNRRNNYRSGGNRRNNRRNNRPSASGSAGFSVRARGNGPTKAGGSTLVIVDGKDASVVASSTAFGFTGTNPYTGPAPPGPPGMYGGSYPIIDPPSPPGVYPTVTTNTVTPPRTPTTPRCSGTCARNYGKCAGGNVTGVRACCNPSYECVQRSDGYAQCRPTAASRWGFRLWWSQGSKTILKCHNN